MAKKAYIGVDGVARKIKKGYVGVENFAKRNLPTGYTQVEYIESSGTQYINTGFKPNNASRIAMDIDVTASSSQSALFGARNGTASSGFNVWTWNNNAGYQVDYGTQQFLEVGGTSSGRHILDLHQHVFYVDANPVNIATTQSFACNYNAYLFTVSSGGNLMTNYPCSAKLYACNIYDNGTMVRDFVPCVNPSGAVGLYDMVNGKFYANEGTGTFTAGTSAHSGAARLIKKAYIGIGGGVTYREVEYIQSSGTQYIDTGFTPNQDTRVVCRTRLPLNSKTNWLFGSRYSTDERKYAFAASSANYYSAHYNTENPRFDKTLTPAGVFTVDFNKQNIGIIADGVTYTTTSTPTYAAFDTPSSMLLFACVTGDSVTCGSSAIYGCQIYDNGKLIRDYVPAINPSGAAGLFDRVTKQFHANAGTGSFSAGSETGASHISVGVARPCWSSGELAYYGKITSLTYARRNLAATSVGDYALFGGGDGTTNPEGRTVDVYNKSLTRTAHADGLVSNSYNLAAETNGDHALFAGGYSGSATRVNVYAFDKSLVRTTPDSLSVGREWLAASSVGDYIIFAGGQSSNSGTKASNVVESYDRSLTRQKLTSLSISRYRLASGKVGRQQGGWPLALFGGGSSSSSNTSSLLEAFDGSLAKYSAPTSLSESRYALAGTNNGKYTIFAGGWSTMTTTDIYDDSMVRLNTPTISVGQAYPAGATLGQYALIGGGSGSTGIVDAFDLSLTRTTPMSGTDLDGNLAAATVGNFALFGGGKNAGTLASVHAITLD